MTPQNELQNIHEQIRRCVEFTGVKLRYPSGEPCDELCNCLQIMAARLEQAEIIIQSNQMLLEKLAVADITITRLRNQLNQTP